MKRTTLAYCLILVFGVALKVMGSLDICANLLPAAVSDVTSFLGYCTIILGISGLIGQILFRSDPVMQQREKERNDERNTAIRRRAKAVSGEALQWAVLGAAWLSIALGAPLWVTLTAVGVFVGKSVLEWCLMVRYQRQM